MALTCFTTGVSQTVFHKQVFVTLARCVLGAHSQDIWKWMARRRWDKKQAPSRGARTAQGPWNEELSEFDTAFLRVQIFRGYT